MSERKTGVLFAVPGTTCAAAAVAFDRIDRAVAARYPGVERYWAYTSAGVRRKAAAQGCRLDDPAEALATAQRQGIRWIAVLSLHLSDGMEYGELREAVDRARHAADTVERITLGLPLLASPDAWRRVVAAVLAETAADGRGDAAVVLVAHGSREAAKRYAAAAALCREAGQKVFLGAIQCPPAPEDVLRSCREAGVSRAWLLPCMVAAGLSAKEDIGGAGESSWQSVLERGGIECIPVIRGLGEFEGAVNVWVDEAGALLAGLEGDSRG